MCFYLHRSSIKGEVHQFYKLALNETLGLPDSENIGPFSVSCSKLLKEAKNLKEIRTPQK